MPRVKSFMGVALEVQAGRDGPEAEATFQAVDRVACAFGADVVVLVGPRPMETNRPGSYSAGWQPRVIHLASIDELEAFARERSAIIVGASFKQGTVIISALKHPDRALYLLGDPGVGPSRDAKVAADLTASVPTMHPLSVPTLATVIIYDRMLKEVRSA